jgi:hypothetical protein
MKYLLTRVPLLECVALKNMATFWSECYDFSEKKYR